MTKPAAPTSTELAFDRTRMAYERTLMAWVRTATSLISFGFTIYKFFQYLREQNPAPPPESWFNPRSFALMMITIGLTALSLAIFEHWRWRRRLRTQFDQLPYSLAAIIGGLVAALGIAGLIAVLLRH